MATKDFLDCKFLEMKVIDSDDDYFTFEGYAATFGNVDRGGDRIKKGAFSDAIKELVENAVDISGTNYKKLMPVLWQHNWEKPIGSFVEMREDAKGLFVCGILPKADDFVRGTVIPQMKVGSVSDMSIGYQVRDFNFEDDVRILEKLSLHETSLVTIPMNPEANVTGFKSLTTSKLLPIAPREFQYDDEEAMERVLKHFGDDDDSHEYGGAFLCRKSDDDENLYMMQIADIVDGELKAIPSAIFGVAATLALKSDIDGSSELHAESVEYINKYYKKMKMESPFKKSGAFRIDDVKSLTERELEQMLKTGAAFSGSAAKSIVGALTAIEQRDAAPKHQRDADFDELIKSINLIKFRENENDQRSENE